ncbi:MAG: diacylglycerol kinase family lipid kinase [Chloroflexi bacterium]|nr:diacylglycerol kinase family lipid kinase [Chloroflexota bacterium]
MRKYQIIANPTAGGGSGARVIPQIERLLTESGLDFDIVRTQRPGHALELAREAALVEYDVVVAAGGDGTANQVLNGLMEAKQVRTHSSAMGILSIGRGNDFAHGIGVPYDLRQACQVLVEDQRRTIDIGQVVGGFYPQGRYFCNCVGVGFDAVVTIQVAKLPQWGGFVSFFVAILKTIMLYYKAPLITIEYDGQTLTQPLLMISIMNGRRLGDGFIMAPNSEPDDGLFDLCMAREVSRARMISLIPHFLRDTQATQESITTGQAARITITAVKGTLPAHTDGEILCVDGQHLEIELLSRQIEIVAPSSGGVACP